MLIRVRCWLLNLPSGKIMLTSENTTSCLMLFYLCVSLLKIQMFQTKVELAWQSILAHCTQQPKRSHRDVRHRKNNRPAKLPLPDATIKAIAAYLIGGRAESKHRALFLTLRPPYRPISPNIIGHCIRNCMRSVGLEAGPYWLRHTYAQNLLEIGASIYEVKEMLGHDSIESTRKYLNIHVELMRKVLFDETL